MNVQFLSFSHSVKFNLRIKNIDHDFNPTKEVCKCCWSSGLHSGCDPRLPLETTEWSCWKCCILPVLNTVHDNYRTYIFIQPFTMHVGSNFCPFEVDL